MRRSARATAAVLLATIFLVLPMFVIPGPAQAYGDVFVNFAEIDMDSCTLVDGHMSVGRLSDGTCAAHHGVSGPVRSASRFADDANSQAVSVDIIASRGVAWMDFHPYDEILFVADIENDGDTIYVDVWKEAPSPLFWTHVGVFRPPGTSAEQDILRRDLSIPDGDLISFTIYDDAGLTDLIGHFLGVA